MKNLESIYFAGFGDFGLPIAQNLQQRGYRISPLFGPRSEGSKRVALLKSESAELPSAISALVMCLPSSREVKELLECNIDRLPPVIIDLTTGNPVVSSELYTWLKQRDVCYIDAAVSGSQEMARKGELTLFVGAREDHPRKDVIEAIGSNVFYFNEPGSGHRAKLINQYIHISNLAVLAEALSLAEQLRLPMHDLMRALIFSSANSVMLVRFGKNLIDRDHLPGFKIKHAAKDVREVLALSRVHKHDANILNEVAKRFFSAEDVGLNEQNITAIINAP